MLPYRPPGSKDVVPGSPSGAEAAEKSRDSTVAPAAVPKAACQSMCSTLSIAVPPPSRTINVAAKLFSARSAVPMAHALVYGLPPAAGDPGTSTFLVLGHLGLLLVRCNAGMLGSDIPVTRAAQPESRRAS